MKKTYFIFFLILLAACARQRLNYQSSHDSGYATDNYPAPQSTRPEPTTYDPAPAPTPTPAPAPVTPTPQPEPQPVVQQEVDYTADSYQTFYDELSPYGSWVNYQSYGYVWVPNEGPGFTPYCSNGYWLYTADGWYWNSNYRWGWAPFHYGRWFYDSIYGWMWVPGHQWAPAWVTWGSYNGYYGWAPIEPGISIYAGYRPPVHYWNFVPYADICYTNVYNYRVTNITVVHNQINVYNNTNSYNNVHYYTGPPHDEVVRSSGHEVRTVTISQSAKPVQYAGNATQVNVYRPDIKTSTVAHTQPHKVTAIENVKPVQQHTVQPVQQQPQPQPQIHNEPVQRPNEQPVQRQPVPVQQQPQTQPQMHNEPVQRQPAPVQQQPQTQPEHRNEPVQRQPAPVQPQPQPEYRNEPVQRQPAPVQQQPQIHNAPAPRPQPQSQPRPRQQPQPQPVQRQTTPRPSNQQARPQQKSAPVNQPPHKR